MVMASDVSPLQDVQESLDAMKAKESHRAKAKAQIDSAKPEATQPPKQTDVPGYRSISAETLQLVTENKYNEERILRLCDHLQNKNVENRAAGLPENSDGRSVALARTAFQEAFMWLNRAILQPQRIALPEDAVHRLTKEELDDLQRASKDAA
jgi:hypothetical protein